MVNERPTLLFIRAPIDALPAFIQLHQKQQLKCLSYFFRVIVLDEPCDYGEMCQLHKPSLTLVESGAWGSNRRVRNIYACPEIPKLGFLNADAFCLSRHAFLSDMEKWKVDTFFTLSVSMQEYVPNISFFVWPNFLDDDLYRDYGERKVVSVLFTGSYQSHYPWRQRIARSLSTSYQTTRSPHFGWAKDGHTASMIYGERYARMLNASYFVPACGTMAREVVRKHFEIPGCKACLITERTPVLEQAGFVDMQNCVFADESNIRDKVDYLIRNLDELANITYSGFQLVHNMHTMRRRDQILKWLQCRNSLRAGQKIVQLNSFASPTVVDSASAVPQLEVVGRSVDRLLLRRGDLHLRHARYDEAEACYLICLRYHGLMAEPRLKLAICSLFKGVPEIALQWIFLPVKATLRFYGASQPDPVEFAYLVVALVCTGRMASAVRCLAKFPELHHPYLTLARWAVEVLKDIGGPRELPIIDHPGHRRSLHHLPQLSAATWIADFCRMLTACGNAQLAERLCRASSLDFGQTVNARARSSAVMNDEVYKHLGWRSPRMLRIRNDLDVIMISGGEVAQTFIRGLKWLKGRASKVVNKRKQTVKEDEFLTVVPTR